MITCLIAAMRRRPDNRERGAATLETVGMYAVAAILAVAVMLVLVSASPVINDRLRQALCMVTTLGQGPCESSTSAAEKHKPTEPCVVSANGHTGAVEASFVLTGGENEQFLVEKLNNGKFRVTRGTGGKVGVGVGAGANASATWDDKTYGGAATASASIAAVFSGGEVYYADDAGEVSDLTWGHTTDVVKDHAFGGSGPIRWVADGVADKLGIGQELPAPDETYLAAGVIANMDAQATSGTASAKAGVGSQILLGTREGADGTSTTYYQASVDGSIGAGGWINDPKTGEPAYAKAGLEGRAESVLEVERDAKGNITAVRNKRMLSGTAEATIGEAKDQPAQLESYTEEVVELPIRTATDQAVAQNYLNTMGLGSTDGFADLPQGGPSSLLSSSDASAATSEFAQAVSDRGLSTKQEFDDSDSTSYGLNFDVAELAKVSGALSVKTVGRRSTSAQYWDGSTWATWKGCGE